MKEKTIGILGGMGPEATLDCFAKIIKNTAARTDQEHLRVVIDPNPKVPARSKAQITSDLIATAEEPISNGAGGIIAGCTEIPLALNQKHLSVPYFDVLTILARAAIIKAGLTPIP
jgi:aspartate/glutamate racemase